MATTADIKIGMCIELDGKTFQIVDFQHVKPGKGPAFVRTKLKNLENGRVLENTFSAGAKIEPVRVERRPYQFTYEDDLGAHFMHTETFEEINIDKNLIDNYDLMADGQIVEVMFHTEKESVLSAELPPIVDMEVTYTEPGIKGDTASTNSLKPATVNTGATIKVPLFINTGDKIRVDTRTREYYERINKDFRSNRASSARVERTNITPSHIDCGGVFVVFLSELSCLLRRIVRPDSCGVVPGFDAYGAILSGIYRIIVNFRGKTRGIPEEVLYL